MLDTATAEDEAAHVVVGLALGLKLRKATLAVTPVGRTGISLGYAWFAHGRSYLAHGVMCCAGIAWDRHAGFEPDTSAEGDYAQARQIFGRKSDVETGVRLARELLDSRRRVHARIASELCDRDLGSADVEALVLDV